VKSGTNTITAWPTLLAALMTLGLAPDPTMSGRVQRLDTRKKPMNPLSQQVAGLNTSSAIEGKKGSELA
jgi:hypothetical protein